VVVLLTRADDDERAGAADPGRETLLAVEVLADGAGDFAPALGLRDDDEPLALAEARARRRADGADDALERLACDRPRFVGAHHPAPLQDLSELHTARIRVVIRRRVVVHGQVQGVFFRDTTRRLAQQRGVAGWVANRWDGTVEAVFEGEEDAVERLVEFCRAGPRGAQVDSVDVTEEEPEGLSGFNVR